MDDVFLKSPPDPLLLEDTSLALPSETTSRTAAKVNSRERSLRVHQQVQLTLARKARKTMSNGSVHLRRHTGKSFDSADGHIPNMKVNGHGSSNCSLSVNNMKKPCRRVEVSPPPSPDLPHNRFTYGTQHFGTHTIPGPGQLQRMAMLLDHSLGSESYQRYCFSEAPRLMRPLTSTSASLRQRSIRQSALPPPAFHDTALHQSVENRSRRSHNQTVVKHEQHSIQRLNSDVMLGTRQPDEGLAWLSQVRKENHGPRRLNSYPDSVTSMEVDSARLVDPEVAMQQSHSGNMMTVKPEIKLPEMTLERAMSLLSQDNEDILITALGYVQNQCFKSADAKKMVYYLRGIGKLMQLLSSDSEEVQRFAAGALRNVVYQSSENKMEVKENDGLITILHTLKSSRDVETRRQLTGLLWNLSSHDLLKEHLSVVSLPVLTQSVLIPSSGISEGENPKDELLADDDVFHNATGCLRNLSSAGPNGRRAMRECDNLIDSLVYYIRGTIADYKTDDKSTENCVCILHNLSYQIEEELPKKYAEDLRESRQTLAPKPKAVGCFAYRGTKITEHLEQRCPLLEEKPNPRGVEWLWSAITIRMYLSLIARSVRHYTQEAALGALQNITAGNGAVTEAISFAIVLRENGLQHVKKALDEGDSDVRRTAVSLIRNLSRYKELHLEIVNHVLTEMVEMLPNNDRGTDLPTEVTTCLCQILIHLSQNDTQNVRAFVNHGALPKIINISQKDNGYGPTRAGQAACVLLHTMWKHTDLHGAFKRCGYRKADFINARTTKIVNSGRD